VSATIGSSAAVRGATAEFSGGSFWKGFAIGATIASANHVAHGLAADIEEARWRRRVERALAQQGWYPLSKGDLERYANTIGYCTNCTSNQLGSLFEDIFEHYGLQQQNLVNDISQVL
jgi:hypothetical protein